MEFGGGQSTIVVDLIQPALGAGADDICFEMITF